MLHTWIILILMIANEIISISNVTHKRPNLSMHILKFYSRYLKVCYLFVTLNFYIG